MSIICKGMREDYGIFSHSLYHLGISQIPSQGTESKNPQGEENAEGVLCFPKPQKEKTFVRKVPSSLTSSLDKLLKTYPANLGISKSMYENVNKSDLLASKSFSYSHMTFIYLDCQAVGFDHIIANYLDLLCYIVPRSQTARLQLLQVLFI